MYNRSTLGNYNGKINQRSREYNLNDGQRQTTKVKNSGHAIATTEATSTSKNNAATSKDTSSKSQDTKTTASRNDGNDSSTINILSNELKQAIQHMVANISKSFIVDWYTSISPTNHDFVASCDALINEVMTKMAELCASKLETYKIGQLLMSLLHDHILTENIQEKVRSVEHQIENFEYDICQNSVVRLFGLLSNENLRRIVFTTYKTKATTSKTFDDLANCHKQSTSNGTTTFQRRHARSSSYSAYQNTSSFSKQPEEIVTKTTSALYTLLIAMLTKAAFMPIIDVISKPNWLFALIIWLCQKEERERAKQRESQLERDLSNQSSAQPSNKSIIRNFTEPNNPGGGDMPPPASIIITRAYRSIDLEEGINIGSPSINFDNPICDSLKRPLDNIEIYATEEVKTGGSCYVLYCIRYDGLCYRHPSASLNFIPEQSDVSIIDKRQTHATNRRLHGAEPRVSSSMIPYDPDPSSSRRSFRRSLTIKRRFREFVLLQLRLEENPKIRPYMKNIPKPTKLKAATQNIFSLPGITNIKLDQSTIKLRQRFLERFLNALNNSPFIGNSYEFKEFFSYNLNPAGVNISKSKSTILQVNLNKVFVDSLRSAFSVIRSTLPGDDYQSLRANPDPDAWLTELQRSTLKLHVQTRTSHSKMNLERLIDSKLLSLNDSSPIHSSKSSSLGRYYQRGAFDWMGGSSSRGGSLKTKMVKSSSTNFNSSPTHVTGFSSSSNRVTASSLSATSSSSSSNASSALSLNRERFVDRSSSKTSSSESIYYDATCNLDTNDETTSKRNNSIQICDSVPIATKFIDIIHYSISKNTTCSKSAINFMARLFLGKTIERYAIQLLEMAFTMKNSAFCINGITNSIWGESDDNPPLDVENASLDEAVIHLTRLVGSNFASHPFLPKQLLTTLISKQIRFYLSQLSSQKRNKFVIYSFFVHLLDELEVPENQQPQHHQA